MSLRFKRNWPIVFLLAAVLTVLVFGIGGYPVIAYSAVGTKGQHNEQGVTATLYDSEDETIDFGLTTTHVVFDR